MTWKVLTEGWFWTMIQALGVIITLILIYFQIKLQTASNRVQILKSIHETWNSEPMLRARFDVSSRYLEGDTNFDGPAEYIAEHLEELGIYVKMKSIPIDIMWHSHSWSIEHYYSMFKNEIGKMKEVYGEETLYNNAKELFTQMLSQSRKRGCNSSLRQSQDLKRFANSEVEFAKSVVGLRSE